MINILTIILYPFLELSPQTLKIFNHFYTILGFEYILYTQRDENNFICKFPLKE